MSVTVAAILDSVRASGASTPPETLTYLGLLLERHARDRYDDPIYGRLFFPPGWLELTLTEAEFDAIVEVLGEVLERHPRLASTAAFALGKARSEDSVRRLAAALPGAWRTDDRLTYQLLVALGNHGADRVADLVRDIAREGLPHSRELAAAMVAERDP